MTRCSRVLATDIRSCDILNLIKKNIANNKELIKHSINVAALDFGDTDLNEEPFIETITDVVAGDIIYDNDITEKFLLFLTKLQMRQVGSSPIFVHVAMEKRYVFTIADLDTRAPAYDFFLEHLDKMGLKYQHLESNFQQYLCYEKSKELVLIKIEI